MTTRPQDLVARFKRKGWDSEPYEQLAGFLRGHEDELAEFVSLYLKDFEESRTFFDDALQFLGEEPFAELIAQAVAKLERSRKGDEAADSVIAHASLQVPHLLAPHLPALWELRPNASAYYAMWPWRAADEDEKERLHQELAARDRRAAEALLETRDPACVSGVIDSGTVEAGLLGHHVRAVGFEQAEGGLRRLAPEACLHVVLPPELLADRSSGTLHLRPEMSPTWFELGEPVSRARWGGRADGECGICHGPLHRLIRLDPVPDGLGVSLPALELATCLSCVGWEREVLYCRHDREGKPTPYETCAKAEEPEFPVDPLVEAEVGLVTTPARWVRQDWGLSNSRQNLHRLGGEPTWIQNPDYPTCPECRRTMCALFQADSELPLENDGELLWGSGGIGYAFWCDGCAISAMLYQCT